MTIQTTRVYAEIDSAIKQGYNTISLQGSSRSSKTYNTLIWLVVYCLTHPYSRLSIVRGTLPALKGSVLVDFKEILIRMGVWEDKALNKSDLIYTFPNGAWVEFFSTDNEQKLRGRKREILFVNEANELSYIEWQQLKMRTTKYAIIDYNPSFSDDHWICSVNNDPRTYHFVSTYRDNPFLEQSIIDEIESLQFKNKSLWQVYGLGQQAIVEGLIFSNVEYIEAMPANVRKRWYGIDFGYTNDPTAIVVVGVDGNDLYIDEVAYATEMLSGDIIRTFKQQPEHYEVIAESADPRLLQEIYRGGINIHPVKKFPGSIDAGIQKMLQYKWHITKRSANVIKEQKNYTYRQDKEGKWLNEPIDAYNHAMDAIRYVVMDKLLGGERKPLDKARIARLAY